MLVVYYIQMPPIRPDGQICIALYASESLLKRARADDLTYVDLLEALPLEAGVLADAWVGYIPQVRMAMHYEAFKRLTGTAFNVDLNQLEGDCIKAVVFLFITLHSLLVRVWKVRSLAER